MTVAGPAAGASRRQAAVSFVLVTVLLDVMGIGLMIPVLPALVGEFTVSRDLQAYWYGVLGAAYGVMNFFATPILGALSDRFGRRRVLLVSIFGLGLDFLLLAVAPSLWVVLLAGVFLVAFGSLIGSLLGTNPPFQGKELFQLQGTSTFLLAVVGSLASGVGLYYLLRGWNGRTFARLILLVFVAMLAVQTARTAWRAAFIDYDDAIGGDEMDDLSLLACFHDTAFLHKAFDGYASVRPLPAEHLRRFWLHLLRNMIVKAVIRVGAGYFDRTAGIFLIGSGGSGADLCQFTHARLDLALRGLRESSNLTLL